MSAWSLVFGGSAVIAAHKTGLLDALLSGSRTSEELGAELGLDQTAMERVIDVLHVVGLGPITSGTHGLLRQRSSDFSSTREGACQPCSQKPT